MSNTADQAILVRSLLQNEEVNKEFCKLVWSEHRKGNDKCHYDHVEAITPFGIIRLEWKGWKEDASIDASFESLDYDISPFKGIYAYTLDTAKLFTEEAYRKFVISALLK